jgi:tetratricopeptide (TPR) repeat protein
MLSLTEIARVQGRLDDASKLAEEALELHRRSLGPDHPQTLQSVAGLATVRRDQGRLAEAKAGFDQALAGLRRAFSPKTPELQRAMNADAWMLATAEDPKYRDPPRAIELANEVVRNSTKIREIWTTLGAAHDRAGDWKDAIAAIEKSTSLAPARFTGANGFILAMAHWQLGERDKARSQFEKARQSMERAIPFIEPGVVRLRSEAAQTLGLPDLKVPSKDRSRSGG